ncbi:MAG: hypothetical protein R2834_08155 [Rhodothermales bacterium]
MRIPDENLAFPGFSPEAFAILARLKAEPHIDRYRIEKPAIDRYLKAPFALLRDDLVVHWVLPGAHDLETERNVFSRLLKNDFGAGGCHHHFWMAFYRPGRTRLRDLQLACSMHPDRFTTGVYIGRQAGEPFDDALRHIYAAPREALDRLNAILAAPGWELRGEGGQGVAFVVPSGQHIEALPDTPRRLQGLWLRRAWPADAALDAGPHLVDAVVEAFDTLAPWYRLTARGR